MATIKDDLKLNLAFTLNATPAPVTGCTGFYLTFYTTNINNGVPVYYTGGTFSSNCKVHPDDDTILIVVFNNNPSAPIFAAGKLKAYGYFNYEDPDFPDGIRTMFRDIDSGVTLT